MGRFSYDSHSILQARFFQHRILGANRTDPAHTRAGLLGKRGYFAYMVLIFTFSMVVVLIYDLDRPKQQLFTVGQRAMIDLQERMNESFAPVDELSQ